MSPLSHTIPRRRSLDRLTTTLRLAPALLRAPVVIDDPHVLRTPNLVLRPLAAGDRASYIALLRSSRDHLARHSPLHREGETDEQVFERHLACSYAAVATGRAWRAVVCLRNGIIAGAVNLNDIAGDGTAELTTWIAAELTRRHICSEALRAVLDHAFWRSPRGLGLTRLSAFIAPDNGPSIRLLEGIGFQRDRGAFPVQLNLAGRWTTHHHYTRRAPAPLVALQRLLAVPLDARLA